MMVKPELVEKAIEEIRKQAANREYFFQRLNNFEWIDPLLVRGLFGEPTLPTYEGTTVSFPFWGESQYLLRMSKIPAAATSVLKAITQIPDTENVRVREDIVEAASNLPANLAKNFVPKAQTWLQSPIHLLLPEKVGLLIKTLAKGNEITTALDLSKSLFEVLPPQESGAKWIREAKSRIDLWDYQEILEEVLPTLAEAAEEKSLFLFCDLLEKTVEFSGFFDESSDSKDRSYIWRKTIAHHDKNHPYGLQDLLVSAVRDVAETIIQKTPVRFSAILKELDQRKWKIFHLIGLYLLTKHSELDRDLITKKLTDKTLFENFGLRQEYKDLLQQTFGNLKPEDQQIILKWIEEGPDVAQLKTEREIKIKKARWTLNQLQPIAHALPKNWAQKHKEFSLFLEEEAKKSASPVVAKEEIKSLEALRGMSIQDRMAYLELFQQKDFQAVLYALRDLISENPREYADHAELFKGFDTTCIRILFQCIEDAVSKLTIDLKPILKLAEFVVAQPREIEMPRPQDSDLDRGMTLKALASLIDKTLKPSVSELSTELVSQVWQILETLTKDPDPTSEDESRLIKGNWDPTMLSINTTRGEAMHAVMEYALWKYRQIEKLPDSASRLAKGFDGMPEVRRVLDWHLEPTNDPSFGIRSVYGQWLPQLVLLDRKWVTENLNRIFPDSPNETELRDAAWETYLALCPAYDNVVDVVMPEYERAITRLGGEQPDRRQIKNPESGLAEHLMTMFWREKVDIHDPKGVFVRFLQIAPIQVRCHAVSYVGRSLNAKEEEGSKNRETPSEVLQQLRDFWESRLRTARESKETEKFKEEIATFGWWFASGKFEDNWALKQLSEGLQIVGKVEPSQMVIERLAGMSKQYPVEVVNCLTTIIEFDAKGWAVLGSKKAIRELIQEALKSKNPVAREPAVQLIHRLGSLGYFEFRDLLPDRSRA